MTATYKHKRREQKYLTEEEIEMLKAACGTFSDQLIVYGILYTGMRVDELTPLFDHYCLKISERNSLGSEETIFLQLRSEW